MALLDCSYSIGNTLNFTYFVYARNLIVRFVCVHVYMFSWHMCVKGVSFRS